MSGTVPIITPGSISGMTGLTLRPVFFLNLNGSAAPNLVVKGEKKAQADSQKENDIRVSIKWSSKLMKNVNNSLVNTKILTPAEVDLFCQFAGNTFAPGTEQHKNAIVDRNTLIWVKMPYVDGLSDADFNNEGSKWIRKEVPRSDPNKRAKVTYVNKYDPGKVKEALGKLLSEEFWRNLGKIVAVDIFNGNSDRFNVSNGEWTNIGNLMFLKNGQTPVIGLDTLDLIHFDSRAEGFGYATSNLRKTNTFESLLALKDPARRIQFATGCLKSVGSIFKMALSDGGIAKTSFRFGGTVDGASEAVLLVIETDKLEDFFLMYLSDFESGLTLGAAELKSYLQRKVQKHRTAQPQPQINVPVVRPALHPGVRPTSVTPPLPTRPQAMSPMGHGKTIPAGILSRMAYLGW